MLLVQVMLLGRLHLALYVSACECSSTPASAIRSTQSRGIGSLLLVLVLVLLVVVLVVLVLVLMLLGFPNFYDRRGDRGLLLRSSRPPQR